MSKADRLKEETGVLKVAFEALIAVAVSLIMVGIKWLAQTFSTMNIILAVLALIAVDGTVDAGFRLFELDPLIFWKWYNR